MTVSRFVNSQGQDESARSARVMTVSVIAASTAATLAGPFGTHLLPLPARILFWVVLIGWNAIKWRLWYQYVPLVLPATRWGAILLALGGGLVLNAMLPFEINFLFRAVGYSKSLPFGGLFLTAAIISISISAVIGVVKGGRHAGAATDVASPAPAPAPAPFSLPVAGLAAREELDDLHAMVAEDHYLRLHFGSGRQALVLYRFGDAVRELASTDGQQIHRGA